MTKKDSVSTEVLHDLLLETSEFIRFFTGSTDLMRRIGGPSKRLIESLVSLEYLCNSVAASILFSLYHSYANEAMILLRSLLEGHAKFMALLLHRDGPEVADWEYNECLVLLGIEAQLRSLGRQKSVIASLDPLTHPEEMKRYMVHVVEEQIQQLSSQVVNLRETKHPIKKDKVSKNELELIAKRWEPANLFTYISGPKRFPYSRAIQTYRTTSSYSHFTAESLIDLPNPLVPGMKMVLNNDDGTRFIVDVLSLLADRHFLLLHALGELVPARMDASLVGLFRKLSSLGISVGLEYLGAMRIVSIEGAQISIVPD